MQIVWPSDPAGRPRAPGFPTSTIIVHCFGGDATPPEVSYGIALAITDGHRSFVEVGDGWQWVLPTPKLGHLDIETLFRGAVLWNGREWLLAHESDN